MNNLIGMFVQWTDKSTKPYNERTGTVLDCQLYSGTSAQFYLLVQTPNEKLHTVLANSVQIVYPSR